MVRTLLSFSLLLFASASTGAQAQQVDRINIIDYGIYTGTTQKAETKQDTAAGYINVSSNIKLVTQTETVSARLGLRFGLRYVVVGQPKGSEVTLTWITRFPPQGLVNAKGEKFQKNEFDRPATIGEPRFRMYEFTYSWEMVSGDWAFEFWYQGRKLGEKRFAVVTP